MWVLKCEPMAEGAGGRITHESVSIYACPKQMYLYVQHRYICMSNTDISACPIQEVEASGVSRMRSA